MIIASLLLSMAQPVADAEYDINRAGNTFVVMGKYYYRDGDRFVWRCSPNDLCIDTIIRDERLNREAADLVGSVMTLRVERVSACSRQSSETACARNRNGSALRIIEWIGSDRDATRHEK
jgi:hypothetical protein